MWKVAWLQRCGCLCDGHVGRSLDVKVTPTRWMDNNKAQPERNQYEERRRKFELACTSLPGGHCLRGTPSTGFDVQSESAEHLRMVLHGLMTTGATKEHVIQAMDNWKTVMMTDCKSREQHLRQPGLHTVMDKRLAIDLSALRQLVWRFP